MVHQRRPEDCFPFFPLLALQTFSFQSVTNSFGSCSFAYRPYYSLWGKSHSDPFSPPPLYPTCGRCPSSGPQAGLTVTFWPWQTGAGLLMQDASPLESHWLMIPGPALRCMFMGTHLLTRLNEEGRLPLETNLWKITNSSYGHSGRSRLNVDMRKERT